MCCKCRCLLCWGQAHSALSVSLFGDLNWKLDFSDWKSERRTFSLKKDMLSFGSIWLDLNIVSEPLLLCFARLEDSNPFFFLSRNQTNRNRFVWICLQWSARHWFMFNYSNNSHVSNLIIRLLYRKDHVKVLLLIFANVKRLAAINLHDARRKLIDIIFKTRFLLLHFKLCFWPSFLLIGTLIVILMPL